jgi:hypothetical protein
MRKLVLALIVTVLPVAVASAQTHLGVRAGGFFGDTAGFVGVDALTTLRAQWYFNPGADLAFGGHEKDLVVSGNVHYDLDVSPNNFLWVGAGPAIVVRDVDAPGTNSTDFGFNLLAGGGFRTPSGLIPYVEARVLLSKHNRVVLGVGVRF